VLGHIGEREAASLSCGAKPLTQRWHLGL